MNGETPEKAHGNVASQPESGWTFKADNDAGVNTAQDTTSNTPKDEDAKAMHWTASEFVSHQKSAVWYVALAAAAIVVAGLLFVVTRGDRISAGAVIVAAIFFGIVAGRKPRVLEYEIDARGITISGRFYPYEVFKSFWVMHEGPFSSMSLMPLKRFMPLLTIYYSTDEEEAVLKTLGSRLPMEQPHRDLLDHFLDRIRF